MSLSLHYREMSTTVHDLPPAERPRERLQMHGLSSLSTQELLALVLGNGVKGESVITLTQNLFKVFGSLTSLSKTSLQDLMHVRGFGLAKAAQLQACFELAKRLQHEQSTNFKTAKARLTNPLHVVNILRNKLREYSKEHFLILSLNTRNELIAVDIISVGTLNASLIHPRETFNKAMYHHAAQIIIAHNHPSGDCRPSDEDKLITKRLVKVGELVGISVVDHVIFSEKEFISFKDRGLL